MRVGSILINGAFKRLTVLLRENTADHWPPDNGRKEFRVENHGAVTTTKREPLTILERLVSQGKRIA